MDRLAADQQLNAACQAITASVAMLRATELQVHEIQDRQGFSPEEATLLCEQVVALRDLLKLRLDEMDSGAKLDGPISRGPSPSRVTAGSRVAWVGEQQHRGGSVPAARMGASQDRASSFKQIRRGPAACSKPSTLPQLIPQLMEAEVEAEVLPLLETISAVLIDLDGTMYSPHGPISGADEFYAFLVRRKIPYVFLSNTGAKGSQGTQTKLAKMGFMMQHRPVPLQNIYTAAQAQVAYMVKAVPHGARVFVIAGGASSPGGIEDSFWMQLLREQAFELSSSWDVRTYLSESEAKEWAATAAVESALANDDGGSGSDEAHRCGVFVVLFSDGDISSCTDPNTGEAGFADWSFDVIKKASYMLSHGAELIVTAEDAFNPSLDPDYPGSVFPLPGPGMFASMFRKLMYPRGEGKLRVCGKGGAEGDEFMIGHSLQMLRQQGHNGDPGTVLIIGDRYDTDVRAGVRNGLRTCLVESGCHASSLQRFFPRDRADYVAANVGELLPRKYTARTALAYPELGLGRTAKEAMCREAKKGVGGAAGRPASIDATQMQASESPTQAGGGEQSRRVNRSQRVRFSSHGDMDLRSWMLARGNLVYAAAGGSGGGGGSGGRRGSGSGGGGGDHGNGVPLMLKLHAFFDAKAVFDAKILGRIATISADDVRKALHDLGLGLRTSQPSTPGSLRASREQSGTGIAPQLSGASSSPIMTSALVSFSPIMTSFLPSELPSALASALPSARPSPLVTPLPTPDATPENMLSVLQGLAALKTARDGSRPPPLWPSVSSGTEHEDNTPLRSPVPLRLPADSWEPPEPPQISMAAVNRRFSFAQFVREIQARMREHTGREVPLFDPPSLHGVSRQERDNQSLFVLASRQECESHERDNLRQRDSLRDGRRDGKPATPRGHRKEVPVGRGLSSYVTASHLEPDALDGVSASIVALVGKDNALRAQKLTEQGSIENFGVARVVRGETTPPQSSPEALSVESQSSRGMGKLLRTRNLHVELQGDSPSNRASPLGKHALSTSDLPSLARAPSPPLAPPMPPLPPSPSP